MADQNNFATITQEKMTIKLRQKKEEPSFLNKLEQVNVKKPNLDNDWDWTD